MTLLITNGILIYALACLPPDECHAAAERLNSDYRDREVLFFCEVTKCVSNTATCGHD